MSSEVRHSNGSSQHLEAAYLTGIQAVARLPLHQRRLDACAGRNTAGFISGYRGSPLGGLDQAFWREAEALTAQRIVFQPGINEDLAATAVWGTQQSGLFEGAQYDGVFSLWYGKAPGLDRSSDALRHANAAGTSPLGGVLLVVGDDHGCKSSTLPNASEFALRDLGIPVLAPANVQDVLDFGLFGWALSRYAGCWVGMVALTDVMDSALTVSVDMGRCHYVGPTLQPALAQSPHIRLNDSPLAQEERLALKERLTVAFANANGIDRIVAEAKQPRLVVVAAGKASIDAREAFAKLGLPATEDLAKVGIRFVKLGMTSPLNDAFVREVTRDARHMLVIEEKRAFVEDQIRNALFGQTIELHGKKLRGEPLLPATGELDVPTIARALERTLRVCNTTGEMVNALNTRYLLEVERHRRALADAPDSKQSRKPLYCAGCPHSTSTRVPAGSRATAGIGCHYMAQWMDRNTHTVTHMGAEGANWIGQAPFTRERHVFVNLGDGTYFHSGILAIRAAVAAGVNVTYKILANDAVAMTGGQPLDGRLTVADIVDQAKAEGVARVRVVADDPRRHRGSSFDVAPRQQLDAVQRQLRETPGCTVLVYDQTCATELRRRRKRGQAVDPDVRVVINDAVCEGCGDCTRQSNCVAIAPLPTALGTKRTIDQTACNKDLSCLAGFCPALVTVKGARLRRATPARIEIDDLKRRLPPPTTIRNSANILIAGVGGSGVVTASQLLGMAAHIDGKFASTLDMTGLAQKGGAVLGHVRISPQQSPHQPTRIAPLGADLLIAADPVTAASRDVLELVSRQHSLALVDDRSAPTAAFVFAQQQDAGVQKLRKRISQHVESVASIAASSTVEALFGTTTSANVFLLGAAFQAGSIPLSLESLEQAIAINAATVADNLTAFHCGRLAFHDKRLLAATTNRQPLAMQPAKNRSLSERIAYRRRYLVAYQDEALARKYETLVQRARAAEQAVSPAGEALTQVVAESYFKLLAVKDEFEVARLFTEAPVTETPVTEAAAGPHSSPDTDFASKLARQFQPPPGGRMQLIYHFSPPAFSRLPSALWPFARRDANGRPKKIALGGWGTPFLRLLAKMRRLRGSVLDPFRFTAERRLAQTLLAHFEADFETIAAQLTPANMDTAIALAQLPCAIKGFGPVKAAAAQAALSRRPKLLAEFVANGQRPTHNDSTATIAA